MATGTIILPIRAAQLDPTNPPARLYASGTLRPYLAFDGGTTDELVTWTFRMPSDYASGLKCIIQWGADTATSGDTKWGCVVMAITANTDTADAETDSYDTGTPNTITDTHLGTTAGRLHECEITLTSNIDSLTASDYAAFQFYRDASDTTNDTLSGDAFVWAVSLEYTTS